MKTHIKKLADRRLGPTIVLDAVDREDYEALLVSSEHLILFAEFIRQDPDVFMDYLQDIVCIDHDELASASIWKNVEATKRLEIIYVFASSRLSYRLALSVLIPKENAWIRSLHSLFDSAVGLECELWDMFGVYPEENPRVKRLLTADGFVGHPLRKAYVAQAIGME